jgi:FlaA1/EpsC-like NDP-sugar epimerase
MIVPFTERRVLLTGAGGSIGSALAVEIAGQNPRSLVLLDHSEGNLHQLGSLLPSPANPGAHSLLLGDVTDQGLLSEIFEEMRPEVVIHAAAWKHVPLMEGNVIAAIQNNALGTYLLAKTAAAYGETAVVMISTDKAAEPHSVMGASKRAAELALLRWGNAQTATRAVRLGNVLGSQGSVVPAFLQQIAAGGPVTVTDPNADRFFFSMQETVELIASVTGLSGENGIYIPQPRTPVRILDLAKELVREAANGREIPMQIVGLRPGDKLNETFISRDESASDAPVPSLRRVETPQPTHKDLDALMELLRQAVKERDSAGALALLGRLVPGYRPSQTALNSCTKQESSFR